MAGVLTGSDEVVRRVDAIGDLIRQDADDAEAQRHLTDRVVDAITDAGIYKSLVPRSLGGLEVDPLTFYRTVEAIARIDGSAGWCTFIQGGGMFICAFLDDDAAEAIASPPDTRIAGAVFPFGRAVAREGGYTATGRWPYASGSMHARWLLAFCATFDGDRVRPGFGDLPEVRVVIVPREQATIHDTWDVSGLAGTGSHDIELAGVEVDEPYAWHVGPTEPGRHFAAPMYRMPFFSYFSWPMAAVALGIAQHAVDEVTALATGKTPAGQTSRLRERALFQTQLAQATARVRSAREWLHAAVARTHQAAVDGVGSDLAGRADFLLAATNATRSAVEAVDLAYTAGGGTANYRSSPLQRCLRDIRALSQHVGTAPVQYEEAGRMLAGLMPESPILLL